jgi:hypothetical protein
MKQSDIIKLFEKTAKINDQIYSVGPFGSRVSFASQQRRALNTVWMLEKTKAIAPGTKVAVIGAGLAGVMVAVALAARKCVVHLYERNPRILSLQSGTTHRYIHPTINFWPEADPWPTTQFPFFDWFADDCSAIINNIHMEWQKYFQEWITKVYVKTVVDRLEQRDSEIYVHATGPIAPKVSKPFKLAILTVGFGEEKAVNGLDTKSYWQSDELTLSEGTSDLSAVSGVGDGGIIDLLRILHRNFNRGRLCLEVINILQESAARMLIKNIESGSEKFLNEANGLESASIYYDQKYTELFDDLPPKAKNLLDQSIRDDLSDPIHLYGVTSKPYSLTAAPIHKLMLTHAILHGSVEYKKGVLTNGPKLVIDGVIESPRGRCIVRHGPEGAFKNLLSDEQVDKLRIQQTVLSDILVDAPFDGAYWAAWNGYPQQDFSSPRFVQFRHPLAAMFVMKEYEEILAVTIERGKASYLISEPASDLGRILPPKLFGIKSAVKGYKVYRRGGA